MKTTFNLNYLLKVSVIAFLVLLHVEFFPSSISAVRIGSVIFLLLVIATKSLHLLNFALIFLLLSLNDLWFPEWLRTLPVVAILIPFLLSLPIVLSLPNRKEQFSWVKKGTLDSISIALVLLTGGLSTIALILWAIWSNKLGVAVEMMNSFSAYSPWIVALLFIPIFALCNALAEEIVYRGVLQESLQKTFKNIPLILILQAGAFAILHFKSGFPNGYLGYSMVFIYGIMLGYLRVRTQGMLAPYLGHVISDLTIGYFMFSKVAA